MHSANRRNNTVGRVRAGVTLVALLASTLLLPTALPAQAAATRPRAGAVCSTISAKAKVSGVNLKCIKNSLGKLAWTRVTAAGRIIVTRASAVAPTGSAGSTSTAADSSMSLASKGPSGYEIIADPNNGGNPEVVYPDPATAEGPNSSLAPAVPSIGISNLTENSVDVTFEPISGVETYQVYLRYNDSFTLKGGNSTHTVVHFDELSPGWDYVACAYYLQPRESAKTCVNIHTPGQTPHWQNYLPGPTGVVATAVDDTIEVQWTELPNAERYTVSIEDNTAFQAGGYTEIGGVRTHIRFNSGSVSPGFDYKVRVSALLTSGDWTVETLTTVHSLGTQPAPPVKLPAPANLRVTDVTPTTVTIEWDVPAESTDVSFWQVFVRHETSFTATGTGPTGRSFTMVDLNPGWGYQLVVSGYKQDTGIWTNEASVSVLLPTG